MSKTTALPLAFLARMAALLDEGFPSFLASLNQPPRSALRVNTLKLSVAEFQALSPWELEPVPWSGEGFLLPNNTSAGLYPLHDAGLYYIQEPSTMAVVSLLAPQPGERILDLCASPGGKATHLAARLGGQGVLIANEIDRQRAEVLRRNLERWGVRNALVLSETPERLARRWPACFDRVVVDAPCSGEGMFRKNEQSRFHWSESHVAGCALRQDNILKDAADLVRPGGLLAYATCTFAPEENEGVIWRFLQSHSEFDLEEPVWQPGFESGHPEWAEWPEHPTSQPHAEALRRAVRLWPHRLEGEGHFVALLRRAGEGPSAAWDPPLPAAFSGAERGVLEAFWQPLIDLPLPDQLLLVDAGRAAQVYAPPPDAPDTGGLRVLQPGWHLGGLPKGRFEPSHSLALGLRSGEVNRRLDEPLGSEQIARYLRGETLAVPGPDGWLLICVEGFPLGWGKRVRDVIKNHYPKALRWL